MFPDAAYFGEATTLTLHPEDRAADGSYSKKVRWISVGYQGPVLIRARRIDGPGTARVRFFYTGHALGDGFVADLTEPTTDLPAATQVQAPGCYAYQIDGVTFTEVIVFRAVARLART
jgi:hypothetical protein